LDVAHVALRQPAGQGAEQPTFEYLIRDHVESYEEGGAVYGRHLDAPLTPDRPVSTKVSGRFDIQ